ncbi:MAG: hypothetical protein OQJ78_10875, partial [Ignavibacteriaceae bacterium]|nr:hypothetical protein [Ignavibacteriaceae bacterium]
SNLFLYYAFEEWMRRNHKDIPFERYADDILARFYKSALSPIFKQLNRSLQRWAMRKYKKLRGRKRRAYHWLGRIAKQMRYLFAHWRHGVTPSAGR